jgi:pimeloyl-ACP methyl ester carboxylesterase
VTLTSSYVVISTHALRLHVTAVLREEWADRLGGYFSDYSFEAAKQAGHFVHYEKPEEANREIVSFFSKL